MRFSRDEVDHIVQLCLQIYDLLPPGESVQQSLFNNRDINYWQKYLSIKYLSSLFI